MLAATSNLAFPLLTASILVPLVGALLIALVPASRRELTRPLAVLFSATTGAFTLWKRFGEPRRAMMQAQLERIARHPGLSNDVFEIASKNLTA